MNGSFFQEGELRSASARVRVGAVVLVVAVVALAVGVLAACSSGQEASRCEICGMAIDSRSGWRAGADAAAERLTFDTPKCLFRYRHQRGEVEGAWVTEYYSQERRSARALFYVLGSNLEGPMGRDLVPIAGREEAERFRRDHHGERVLAFDEVTPEIVQSLFRPSP